MTPEEAATAVIRLAKKIAWSPHSGLHNNLRGALRRAISTYERTRQKLTAFDHVMSDVDPFEDEKEEATPKCAYSKCGMPMMGFRHARRKYHSTACRKAAFAERQKEAKKGV